MKYNPTLSTQKVQHFLETEELEKTKVYKELKCSLFEADFLRFLTSEYILTSDNQFIIGTVLKEYVNDLEIMKKIEDLEEDELSSLEELENELEDFSFIQYIPNVKKLLELGWIFSLNPNFQEFSEIDFLSLPIHLDQSFLFLIQNEKLLIPSKVSKTLKKSKYDTYFEYLQDNFLLIDLLYERYLFKSNKVLDDAPKSLNLKSSILKIEESINKKIKNSNIDIPFENFIKTYNISKEQKIILTALLKEEYIKENEILREEKNLLGLIESKNEDDDDFEKLSLFNFSQFTDTQTIDFEDIINGVDFSIKKIYFLSDFMLKALKPVVKIEDNHKEQFLQTQMEKISKDNNNIFEILQSDIKIEDVVLNAATKDLVNVLKKQTDQKTKELLISWGIKEETDSIDGKIIFHGKPGTGKTMTATALGNLLNKKILAFDCSKILDMYVGESEKNVRKIFDTYKDIVRETGEAPILLLNEADQFLSSRNTGKDLSGTSKMTNQMQNIFLEQIENFKGILIATTNLISNLDKAFSRRFNYKIEFKLPNKTERKKIWEKQLPNSASYEQGFNIDNLLKYELSGGQINLIVKNTALKVACRNDHMFKEEDFINEIKNELDGSFENNKKMGFISK